MKNTDNTNIGEGGKRLESSNAADRSIKVTKVEMCFTTSTNTNISVLYGLI